MTTKLTLSVDAAVIFRAKRYAKRSGVSVSALVENYLAVVSQPTAAPKPPPRLQELRGILKGADVSQYRKHLERKYR